MKHQVTGYANVTTQKIIIHLYAKYGNITAEVLEENEHKTKTDYKPNQPIKALYIQLNQAINFTDAASTPFIQSQIIATAYNMVFTTGLYNNTCREWRRCLPADKTWAKFQADYSAAAQDLQKLQATAQFTGYHGANAASEGTSAAESRLFQQDTATALAYIALASVTSAMDTANAEIASLKRKLKIQSNPAVKDKTGSSMKITVGPMIFDVGRSTPVHPASSQRKATKKS